MFPIERGHSFRHLLLEQPVSNFGQNCLDVVEIGGNVSGIRNCGKPAARGRVTPCCRRRRQMVQREQVFLELVHVGKHGGRLTDIVCSTDVPTFMFANRSGHLFGRLLSVKDRLPLKMGEQISGAVLGIPRMTIAIRTK